MATVVVAGEVIVDRFITPSGAHDVLGGSAANTALALHRAGHLATLRARFAKSPDGRLLHDAAAASGIDLRDSVSADEPATVVQILLCTDGIPSYQFAMRGTADWQWTRQELAKPLPFGCDAVIVGSLASVLSPGSDALLDWAAAARQSRVNVCYDPNARPSFIG